MRTIQFRAWDTTLKVMYSDICDVHFDKGGIIYSIEYTKNWSDKKGIYGKYIELMQYTGLLDKNGKEIYEGDIVIGLRHEERAPRYEVYFDDEILAFMFKKEGSHHLCDLREIEVIGNIYQHPELLK